MGVAGRIALAHPELVEIVVAGDLIEPVQLFVGGDRFLLIAGERQLCACERAGRPGLGGQRLPRTSQEWRRGGDDGTPREAHELEPSDPASIHARLTADQRLVARTVARTDKSDLGR